MTELTVVERRTDYAVVSLDDLGVDRAAHLRSGLSELLTDETRILLVDVSGVQRLSSDIVSALLWVRRQAVMRGGRVVLRAPTRRSATMLARSELSRLFDVDLALTPTSPWRHP